MEKTQQVDVKNQIRQMEIGDEISFPIERLEVVRVYACSVGLVMGRNYKTRTDRENMTITVVRES